MTNIQQQKRNAAAKARRARIAAREARPMLDKLTEMYERAGLDHEAAAAEAAKRMIEMKLA